MTSPAVAVVAGIAVAALVGCASVGDEDPGEAYHPATVEQVSGSDGQRVTITDDAASRIALETAPVGTDGGVTTVPYGALLYDGEGAAWVYVEDGALSFVRRPITVLRVDGDRVVVDDTLATAERVATTGATELYGAELGIDGSH